MKILFLHIGDMHIKSNENISNNKIKAIGNILNNYSDVESVQIICTGDLANSGKREEYEKVKIFFDRIIKTIKEKYSNMYIGLYFVPGNHDIKLNVPEHDIESPNDKLLNNQFDNMIEYFQFSNLKLGKSLHLSTPYDIANISSNVGDLEINFNLINTAPFSSLKKDDKEKHYVSLNSIEKIRRTGDLSITIMHHSTEWFHESVKNELDRAILNNTDILFIGHEHEQRIQNLEENNNSLCISKCGAFDTDEYYNNTYFNIVVYDSIEKEINIYNYSWHKQKQIFTESKEVVRQKLNKGSKYKYNQEYLSDLVKDKKVNISLNLGLNDYFVFPEIRWNSDDYEGKINDFNQLMKYIIKNKYVSICGQSESGKTSLLKMIYLQMKNEKLSLFIDKEDIHGKIKTVIKNAIIKQFDDNNIIDIYNQTNKEDKAIIIDDFNLIEKEEVKDELIKYLKNEFGTIIFVGDNKELNLKEVFKDNYALNISILNVYKFTQKQRKELINKLSTSNSNRSEISMVIENNLNSAPMLEAMGNSFMTSFIKVSISQGNLFANSGKQGFNVIFENTLRKAIIDNAEEDNVDQYVRILEFLARESHFKKQELFESSLIDETIDLYNTNYRKHVSKNKFKNVMKKSLILKEEPDNYYSFVNKMYLAYFVACNINFQIRNDRSYDDYTYILKNICFGINGDILLFLIYISQEYNLMDSIYNQAFKLTENWESLSFDRKNIQIFYSLKNDKTEIEEVSEEAIEIEEKKSIEREIIRIEDYDLTCSGLYNYDEESVDDFLNQVTCSLKCVELLARGLQSFNASLYADKQEKIVKGLYTFVDKILYKILKEFDTDFDDFIDYIINTTDTKSTHDKVAMNFIMFLLSFIISLYDQVASLCTSNQTFEVLEQVGDEFKNNSNSRLFKLVIIENTNKQEKFIKEMESFLNDYSQYFMIVIIRKLILKRVYTRKLTSQQRIQMIDKYNHTVKDKTKIDSNKVMISKIKKDRGI